MDKSSLFSYNGQTSAPEEEYKRAQEGYLNGGYPHSSYPPQSGYQPVPGPPQTPNVPRKYSYGWCEDTRRNKPQSNSLGAASLIFTSGGMSLAGSFSLSTGNGTHMQICWFVAVIIGATIAALLIDELTKRIFNLISSVLVIINGVLFLSAPYSSTSLIFARYFDGIAFGLTLVPAIVAGSEQSIKRLRGMVLSVEQVGLSTGIMLKILCTQFWGNNWEVNSNQMHGIFALIIGAIALLFTFACTIESTVFFLRKNNEAEAINSLRRLQRPRTVTSETYALLDENKHLLEEDIVRGRAVNVSTGLVPMIKMCIFRSLVSMSFSLPLTWALIFQSNEMFSLFIYAVMRLFGSSIATFALDTIGRKAMTAFALIVGGGLMIGIGTTLSSYLNLTNSGNVGTAILMTYQVFAGLAAPASTCYLGEAFSISVKPYFILFIVVIENVVQIIICCTFSPAMESMLAYTYALGSLQIFFAIFFSVGMPETKQTTLREALDRFEKSMNINMYQN